MRQQQRVRESIFIPSCSLNLNKSSRDTLCHFCESVAGITPAACCKDITAEVAPIRFATVGVTVELVRAVRSEGKQAALEATFLGTGRLSSLERPLQSIVEYVLVCTNLGDSTPDIDACWTSLVELSGVSNTETLLAYHSRNLVARVCEVKLNAEMVVDVGTSFHSVDQ